MKYRSIYLRAVESRTVDRGTIKSMFFMQNYFINDIFYLFLLTFFFSPLQSNISILKNTNPDESLCNCHEVNNDQDLVINPYINYSSLSHRNHGRNQNQNNQNQNQSNQNQNQNHFHHSRQEPIYQNQHEIQNQNSQVYPIYR